MKAVIRIGAALVLLATQPWCWCGAAGPPQPPKAEAKPTAADVADANGAPTIEAQTADDDTPAATQDSD